MVHYGGVFRAGATSKVKGQYANKFQVCLGTCSKLTLKLEEKIESGESKGM